MLRSKFVSPILLLLLAFVFLPGAARSETGRELHKKAQDLVSQKKIPEAEQAYLLAVEASPKDGWILADSGQFFLWQTTKFAEAVVFFDRALAVNYDRAWVFRQKGIALYRLKKYAEAQAVLQEAVRRAELEVKGKPPDSKTEREFILASGWLADIYITQDEYGSALKVLDHAVSVFPGTKESILAMAGLRAASALGHAAFGKKDYNSAESYFGSAKTYASRTGTSETRGEAVDLDLVLKLVQKRKALGDLKPVHTYHLQIVFIPVTEVDFVSSKGDRIKEKRTLTESMRIRTKWTAESFARHWEAMSDGKIEVEVRYADVNTNLPEFRLRISKNENTAGQEIREPDTEKSSDALVEFFGKTYADTDTFVLIWNGEGIATTANGGSRPFPVDEKLSVVRGFVHISGERLGPPGAPRLFLHEMQHTVESIVGNLSVDGKLETRRKNFPQCDGSADVRYFNCLFEKSLPGLFGAKDKFKEPGFQNLNYRLRQTKLRPRTEVKDPSKIRG